MKCRQCTAKAMPGHTRCAIHRERDRAWVAKHRAAGFCTCGSPRLSDHTACRACLDRAAERKRIDYALKRAQGLCGHKGCPREAAAGHAFCTRHRVLMKQWCDASRRRAREKRNATEVTS